MIILMLLLAPLLAILYVAYLIIKAFFILLALPFRLLF